MNQQLRHHSPVYVRRFGVAATQFTIYFLAFVGGLAATRILYELFFPALAWLGRPLPALSLSAVIAFVVWGIWLRFAPPANGRLAWHINALAPLLLNFIYLADPTVDLIKSRVIFIASLWLLTLLLGRSRLSRDVWHWWGVGFIVPLLLAVYLLTMSAQVGRDDVFEFQVVTPQLGIVHPTGYPLYLLLGKLFTLLPVGSVAWRLNFASAVYATAAACLLFWLIWRLSKRPLPAVLGAVTVGLLPTMWSQAIVAEVYALNGVVVTAVLLLLLRLLDASRDDALTPAQIYRWIMPAALILGLGLTNHLTTVILIPPMLVTLFFARRMLRTMRWQQWVSVTTVFVLPLLLYAYLPLRWQAVVGEPMGYGRFVDWVIGGRFQGALQLMAWLRDPTRYDVVSRLFVENWGWFNLGVALVGLIMLLWQRRQAAVVLLLTWSGYTFYCLNYYVPDLAVFLLPAQIVVGIWWAYGLVAIVDAGSWALKIKRVSFSMRAFVLVLLLTPILLHVVAVWPQVDQSADDGRTRWGTAVLALPLAENSAILADSDKYPPLYYLQQTEGMRPDLDISVWPDEAAYREQLSARLVAGQTVYLARFLPGLEGSYHLRSMGPLTEVSTSGLTALLAEAVSSDVAFGGIRLLGYVLEPDAAVAVGQTAVTFYWQAADPVAQVLHVYVRWFGEPTGDGQHPVNNNYPTVAWQSGEVVPDYHVLPQPVLTQAEARRLQVALAPPFASPDALDWQTVAEVDLLPTQLQELDRPFRIQSNAAVITGASIPSQSRPQKPLPILVSGIGDPGAVSFSLAPLGREPLIVSQNMFAAAPVGAAYVLAEDVATDVGNGRYQLVASHPGGMICGWMQPLRLACALSEVDISGVALADGATNFEDKIALLSVEIENPVLQPGGQMRLALHWQSLAALDENYTVFVQVLDAQDRIVGQVDAWPLQGTYPTTAWTPGEQVTDPYVVQLDGVLPPGAYRLQVGWYLLATLRRLPVVDDDGVPFDDKLLLSGLIVQE